ncbi:type II secretion system F family protein [Candidatus Nitronereus thalassa]|uniref:Type II secretion system F family protein n=1 Tax=Candidatus Nitronereus thalassa TaxID=3020898 RepID=A0ABU3K3M3_9BACT|nr:type II secretion system F family protein [Candidatus Nitronereus thalassa]MDT7041007.1 type II secretion system F family protein [Candidatus Nitronereus thalassa]
MDQALIIAFMVFMMTVLTMVGVYTLVRSRQTAKDWGERIRGRTPTVESTETGKGLAYLSGIFLKLLERLGQANKPKDQAETSRLKKTLVTAGYRGPRAPVIFLGSKIFLGILFGALFFIFGDQITKGMTANVFSMIMIATALGGFYMPQLWLSLATSQRKQKLLNGFPDALDLMVVCVEAGLGLDQAIARVGEEIKIGHKDLGDEFQLVSLELRAGFSREQALRNLSDRTDIDEIRSLIALLIQTDRFGTSVGQALRVHSDSMRMNRRLRAEEMAAKLPVKLMLPLIVFIFPSLMVVIIGPGAIKLIRNFLPAMSGS